MLRERDSNSHVSNAYYDKVRCNGWIARETIARCCTTMSNITHCFISGMCFWGLPFGYYFWGGGFGVFWGGFWGLICVFWGEGFGFYFSSVQVNRLWQRVCASSITSDHQPSKCLANEHIITSNGVIFTPTSISIATSNFSPCFILFWWTSSMQSHNSLLPSLHQNTYIIKRRHIFVFCHITTENVRMWLSFKYNSLHNNSFRPSPPTLMSLHHYILHVSLENVTRCTFWDR